MKRKNRKYVALPAILIVIAVLNVQFINKPVNAQKEDEKSQHMDTLPELVFQSGFENNSQVIPTGNDNDIIGKDLSLPGKSDWIKDMDNAIGGFNLQYTGGDSTKRYAKIIPEPGNPSNKVLQFYISDSWPASEHQMKARVQANIYDIKRGFKEIYQSVKVYLHNDCKELQYYPDKITWLTISEFWNNEWWSRPGQNHGFRMSLGIGKPVKEPSKLNFTLTAEDEGFKAVWQGNNTKVKVPIGKWFTMEYYIKEGDNNSGRFYMAITPDGGSRQVVFDIHNYTHSTTDSNPDGLTDYNPMKLYTSKELVAYMKSENKTLQIYWDDLKIWKNKRPDDK